MLDDKTLAMLGDKKAAERLTDKGELVPCPVCKSEAVLYTWRREKERQNPSNVKCSSCGLQTRTYIRKKRAIKAWNTRAPILSSEEMEMLEGME